MEVSLRTTDSKTVVRGFFEVCWCFDSIALRFSVKRWTKILLALVGLVVLGVASHSSFRERKHISPHNRSATHNHAWPQCEIRRPEPVAFSLAA